MVARGLFPLLSAVLVEDSPWCTVAQKRRSPNGFPVNRIADRFDRLNARRLMGAHSETLFGKRRDVARRHVHTTEVLPCTIEQA